MFQEGAFGRSGSKPPLTCDLSQLDMSRPIFGTRGILDTSCHTTFATMAFSVGTTVLLVLSSVRRTRTLLVLTSRITSMATLALRMVSTISMLSTFTMMIMMAMEFMMPTRRTGTMVIHEQCLPLTCAFLFRGLSLLLNMLLDLRPLARGSAGDNGLVPLVMVHRNNCGSELPMMCSPQLPT
eukprot:Rmarinus@m.771